MSYAGCCCVLCVVGCCVVRALSEVGCFLSVVWCLMFAVCRCVLFDVCCVLFVLFLVCGCSLFVGWCGLVKCWLYVVLVLFVC